MIMKGNNVYLLSKPLADAIVEARNHNAYISDIDTLEALCTTGATLESLLEHKQAPFLACWYAFNIIKGRWPEAEATIMTSPEWAYRYAYKVIKGRWPEAEAIAAFDPHWLTRMLMTLLKAVGLKVKRLL